MLVLNHLSNSISFLVQPLPAELDIRGISQRISVEERPCSDGTLFGD